MKKLISRFKRLLTYCEHPAYFSLRKQGVFIPLYEEMNQPWLREMKFKTILDVGSNTGQFAGVARTFFPEAQMHCFEPLPECGEVLDQRWGDDARVRVHRLAVSDSKGEATFYRSSFTQASSLIGGMGMMKDHKPWIAEDSSFTVPTVRLDDLVPAELAIESPCLLKIDVEGAADKVIRGASQLLRQIDVLLVELEYAPLWPDQALFHDTYARLTDAGMVYLGALGQVDHSKRGFPVQCNAAFVSQQVFEHLTQEPE